MRDHFFPSFVDDQYCTDLKSQEAGLSNDVTHQYEAQLFRRLQCRKDEEVEFLGEKKLTTKSRRPRHGCFGVNTSLIINHMQPPVYQTKADDLPQRMMWV